MRKRPLCTAAVAVLILLAAVNIWFESAISNPCTLRRIIPDASQVTVTGQVKRWEEKSDYRIFYLRDCQVLQKENNTNSDRQSVNKQFKEQVKAKVLQEPELLIYIEQDQKETQTIKLGNQIQIQGELSYFKEARNPGNFDRKTGTSRKYMGKKLPDYRSGNVEIPGMAGKIKKKLEETFSQSDGSTSRKQHERDLTGREK